MVFNVEIFYKLVIFFYSSVDVCSRFRIPILVGAMDNTMYSVSRFDTSSK